MALQTFIPHRVLSTSAVITALQSRALKSRTLGPAQRSLASVGAADALQPPFQVFYPAARLVQLRTHHLHRVVRPGHAQRSKVCYREHIWVLLL